MSDKMIKTTFGELAIGDEFSLESNFPALTARRKISRDECVYVDGGPMTCREDFWRDSVRPVYIKEPEMDKKQKAIKVIEAAEAEIKKAKAILAEEEVTYSIGDRFKHNGNKYILVFCGGSEVMLTDLGTSWFWCRPTKVGNYRKITASEMHGLTDRGVTSFKRYWDARKQCKV